MNFMGTLGTGIRKAQQEKVRKIKDFTQLNQGRLVIYIRKEATMMELKKSGEIFCMFRDYWKLLNKRWQVKQDEEYWAGLCRDLDGFYEKYHTEFAKALTLALAAELERRFRNGKTAI